MTTIYWLIINQELIIYQYVINKWSLIFFHQLIEHCKNDFINIASSYSFERHINFKWFLFHQNSSLFFIETDYNFMLLEIIQKLNISFLINQLLIKNYYEIDILLIERHFHDMFNILIILHWTFVQQRNATISVYIWLQIFDSYSIKTHEFWKCVDYDIYCRSCSTMNFVEIWLLIV